jgi:glycosyltransferase involved in cell wall biosynthesis
VESTISTMRAMIPAVRLVLATDVTVAGGVDVYVRALAQALVAAGHEPELAVERSSMSSLLRHGAPCGVSVHRLRLHHRSHPAETIDADVDALLDARRPDGVHVACGVPWSCLALRRAVVRRGLPLVVTEQYVPDDLELDEAQSAEIERSYRHARRVVFVSRGNLRRMGELVRLEGVAAEVVPNAVPVAAIGARAEDPAVRARRLRDRAANGGIHLVTALRLSPEKGVGDLLEAVAALPVGIVRLTVYGDGPLRGTLEARARELRIDARFSGWTLDIVGELRAADVFVLPSHHEGMPFALLEALAAGVSAVATRTPGSVEALDDGRAGLLVPVGDPPALAEALRAIAADPGAALHRADAGRALVARSHDLAAAMVRTTAVWKHGAHGRPGVAAGGT